MKKFIQGMHICQIFDLIKYSDTSFICQACQMIHDQQSFEAIKKATNVRFCNCSGISKQMKLQIPHPVSGWETHTIYYCCLYCGGKYMFHKFQCDTENCSNYCDISEIYCLECRQNMK